MEPPRPGLAGCPARPRHRHPGPPPGPAGRGRSAGGLRPRRGRLPARGTARPGSRARRACCGFTAPLWPRWLPSGSAVLVHLQQRAASAAPTGCPFLGLPDPAVPGRAGGRFQRPRGPRSVAWAGCAVGVGAALGHRGRARVAPAAAGGRDAQPTSRPCSRASAWRCWPPVRRASSCAAVRRRGSR
jgi:hypothetical protein